LRRVLGWRESQNKASFAFGHALEEAIQYHHDHEGVGAVDDFVRRWSAYKDKELKYTNTEKNWETCLQIGKDMVRLYIVMQPKLPLPLGARTVFQRQYEKEVFPNDEHYGEIFDTGKLDMVAYTEPNHGLLPKVDWSTERDGQYRRLICDIKTSNVDLPETPGLAAFDHQLRRYSWLTGIRDVALLWFKKSGIGYKRNYPITVLNRVGTFEPGSEGFVAKQDGTRLWIVPGEFALTEERLWIECTTNDVTRQRLRFNSGRVSEKSATDAGGIAARQIVQIVNAWQRQDWPQTFGIRFPKDDKNDAYFRAFVLGDERFKQSTFVKSDEQLFDDLFDEDEDG